MADGTPPLSLDAAAVNALLRKAFPEAEPGRLARVVELEPGRARLVQAWGGSASLRPGGVISGPTLMGVADVAAYALVLGHVGEQLMAVTSNLSMNFLRGAAPGDLWAEAELLRMGRRNAVMDVRLWTEGPGRLAAQAPVTYALPQSPSG